MAKKRSKKDKPANKAYTAEKRWLTNKAKKLAKHQKEHPNDKQEVGTKPDYKRKKPLPQLYGRIPSGIQSAKRKIG